jgi:hypothetical protein
MLIFIFFFIFIISFLICRLLGTLPDSIGNLTLHRLILSGNNLVGTIPNTLGNKHATLTLLYLDNNQLTGTLPANLANNPLQGLTLDLNHLTGTIPSNYGDIGSQLMVISAAFNDFSGMFPSGLCHANSCNFQYNSHLKCPNDECKKCALPLCNCGKVCYSGGDCSGGSCGSCSRGPWGYTTCGGQ